ncbi:(2Fe-2S)-binding protein [Pseudactinotalea sp. Z1748]|uniref:(2Fe-2S)-binding protein n=1 Tax=Pseudactinotalea sp. Z1748 TaxID=3413027 RepID=UPI003C7C8344
MSTDPDLTITVDGQAVQVPPGRTVAAVLMAQTDRMAWRRTRFAGQPRGLFCGIGVCFDCLVSIDGRPSMRACLVQAAEGMVVRTGTADDAGAALREECDDQGSGQP